MTSLFGIFRTACVWVLVPLTLASGLPQKHCRRAEAEGKRLGDCCFANPATAEEQPDATLSPCCQAHRAAATRGDKRETGACPTCGRSNSLRSGGCCYWKDGAPRIVAGHVSLPKLPAPLFDTPWTIPTRLLPASVEAASAIAIDDSLAPPDLVILLRHLLI